MTTYYMRFDMNNELAGRYYTEDESTVPADGIVTEYDLWYRTMQEWDGVWKLDPDGQITKHPYPPPTAEQILANNQEQQSVLLAEASQAMAPILVSLQLGDATDDETTTAKAWQAYYRALKVVDVTVTDPQWPVSPQVE